MIICICFDGITLMPCALHIPCTRLECRCERLSQPYMYTSMHVFFVFVINICPYGQSVCLEPLFAVPQWQAPWQCTAPAGRRLDATRKREPPCGVVRKSRRRGATVNGLSVIALFFFVSFILLFSILMFMLWLLLL